VINLSVCLLIPFLCLCAFAFLVIRLLLSSLLKDDFVANNLLLLFSASFRKIASLLLLPPGQVKDLLPCDARARISARTHTTLELDLDARWGPRTYLQP